MEIPPIAGWFMKENPTCKWMIFWGTPMTQETSRCLFPTFGIVVWLVVWLPWILFSQKYWEFLSSSQLTNSIIFQDGLGKNNHQAEKSGFEPSPKFLVSTSQHHPTGSMASTWPVVRRLGSPCGISHGVIPWWWTDDGKLWSSDDGPLWFFLCKVVPQVGIAFSWWTVLSNVYMGYRWYIQLVSGIITHLQLGGAPPCSFLLRQVGPLCN